MMGTALIDLYSSNYNESTRRKVTSQETTNDGNGNPGSIIKNKKIINKDKKLVPNLRNLFFDTSSDTKDYHTLSNYSNSELLVNISEEEEKIVNNNDENVVNDKKNRQTNPESYKSSSDGCKINSKQLLLPISNSMNILNNNDTKQQTQIESKFGKIIAHFPMIYVGQKYMDKKYTLPMLPWLVAEFRREVLPLIKQQNFGSNSSFSSSLKKYRKRIWFEIRERCIIGFDRDQNNLEQLKKSLIIDDKEAFSKLNVLKEGYIFLHKNNWICKIQDQPHEDGDLYSFIYLTRDFGTNFGQNNENKPYTLHVFECDEKQIMTDSIEIIKSVNKELLRSEELGMSSADSLLTKNSEQGSLVDNYLSNSQQYEVLYLGKLSLAQKRALPSFIDETVDNLKKRQQEKSINKSNEQLNKTNIPKFEIDDKENLLNRKLSICSEEHSNNLQKTIKLSDSKLSEQTYQNKNHLNLPSNHSLITNTQSLDDTTRESILSDLKEVNKQQITNEQKPDSFEKILTDNLNELGEIKRTSSAKNPTSHTSKLNTVTNKLQMRPAGVRLRSASGDTRMNKQVSLPLYGRPRTGSGGSERYNSILQLRAQNRTMLLLICRFEICILSLDNQQILLNKSFNNVTHCCQGVNNPDHFGIICKEQKPTTIFSNYKNQLDGSNSYLNRSNSSSSSSIKSCVDSIDLDSKNSSTSSIKLSSNYKLPSIDLTATTEQDHYNCYIFRGENEKLVNEIMFSLEQAFRNAYHTIQQSKTKGLNVFCSDCPLKIYNQLCINLQDLSVEKQQCVILNKIGELLSNEQKEIMSGYEGVQVNSIREQNEILMSLLKRFYEKKQLKHSVCKTIPKDNHLTVTNRNNTSALDNFRQKAKKSLSTSFETILKLRHTDSNTEHLSENLAKLSKELRIQNEKELNNTPRSTSNNNLLNLADGDQDTDDQPRKRSSTISGSKDLLREMSVEQDSNKTAINSNKNDIVTSNRKIDHNRLHSASFTSANSRETISLRNKSESLPPKSPLVHIFMKIGNQNKSGNTSDENLGNSSSASSSSNLGSNLNQNESLENTFSFNHQQLNEQINPNSILKQPNKQSNKHRSLEKTIEFSPAVTSIITDSNQQKEISLNICKDDDEEKDILYDEDGQLYRIENDDEFIEENTKSNAISMRKAIFSSIHSNTRRLELSGCNNETKNSTKNVTFDSDGLFANGTRKRTREELRELWRKAIAQQILLIKMEKENLQLQENQHEVEDKRLKLDYKDVITCSNADEWQQILFRCDEYAKNTENIGNFDCFGNTQNFNLTKFSSFLNSAVTPSEFAEAILKGVPKTRRGEIWCLLADIRERNNRPVCSPEEASVQFDTNYRLLLQQLTSQQHAILVDLGRTFPKHPYFAAPLGSGQLCLFNLLKAYSLFDKEVSYCQGLSFVAGILLLHCSEDESFYLMKHLLFFLGLRKQYKPDMSALQMQFYQLTRLLYDHHRELYEHFEKHDISPVLYAAPWFLTLFASQFSISFVSRLFDYIFLFGLEAIFRVSLSLLAIHKQSLLNCNSFESIIYYLKNDLIETENNQIESLFNIAFALDITRELLVYEIEYQVIQEEMQYQPLTITYDTLKAVNQQTNLDNNKLKSLNSVNHLKTNQPKIRKISCSAIQQPVSPYQHLKQRKISSSIAVGTTDTQDRINFLTDTQNQEKLKEFEKENKNLKNRNMELLDQLHVAQSSVIHLESSLDSYKSTIKRLETRVRTLEDERDALLHMVNKK